MDASGVIKVADFGLSEDIYTRSYYRQKKSDTAVRLPVRWMALESTSDGIFTEKSGVVSATNTTGMEDARSSNLWHCVQYLMQWSFGVTCWEVFTGGHTPYSGISPVALLQLLRNGERLNKPMNPACSDEMWVEFKEEIGGTQAAMQLGIIYTGLLPTCCRAANVITNTDVLTCFYSMSNVTLILLIATQ